MQKLNKYIIWPWNHLQEILVKSEEMLPTFPSENKFLVVVENIATLSQSNLYMLYCWNEE